MDLLIYPQGKHIRNNKPNKFQKLVGFVYIIFSDLHFLIPSDCVCI